VTNSVSRGGAERQTALWAFVCESLGNEVEIVALHRREHLYPLPESAHVEFMMKSSRLDLPRIVRSVRALAQRVDVVVAFQAYCGLLCYLARPARPLMFVAGGDPRRLRDSSRMPRWLLRKMIGSAAVAVAPSHGLSDCHRAMGLVPRSGAWVTIPNIADDSAFVPGTADRSGALWVGRLGPEKDPLLALDAALGADVPLTFLGGFGALRDDVEAAAAAADGSDLISFRDFTPRPWDLYGAHRTLLLTSRYETFGNVIIESLAAGTPVVSVDCDFGPREVLAGARFSEVVPREREALVAALARVVERPYGEDEARECREIAERYRSAAIAPQIADALELTLAGARTPAGVA